MRKIKIKEIVCIIGLLGTLTAHSQNTVWQIGNKDCLLYTSDAADE